MRKIKFEPRSVNVPPVIRLKGKWLIAAGFNPGEHVTVTTGAPGELHIRRAVTVSQSDLDARFVAAFRRAA